MATIWYAHEHEGDDTTGSGTLINPYKTVRKCLDRVDVGNGDYILFKPYYWDWNKPNPGISHSTGFGKWAYCLFVDPTNGTNNWETHGRADGEHALASLQYAMDNAHQYNSYNVWIFCKGIEKPGVQIDLDNHSIEGCWSVVEGYTTDPRGGGYYELDGEDGVATALKYYGTTPGILVANIHAYNYTGNVILLGTSTQGSWAWNIWAEPAATKYGFYSSSWLNYVYLLFCRSTGGAASFNMYQASLAYLHCCYGENATTYGVYTTMSVITNRCVMRSTVRGYQSHGGRIIALDSVAHHCSEYGFAQTAAGGILLGMGSVVKGEAESKGFVRRDAENFYWAVLLNANVDLPRGSPKWYGFQLSDGMLYTDAQFVDPDNGNFSLAPGSPLWSGGVGVHPQIASGQHANMGPHVRRQVPVRGRR